MMSENDLIKFCLIVAVSLVTFDLVYHQTVKGETIEEDQVIICIADKSDTINRNHLICHVFDADDVDWYQELSEPNYGNFGSLNDSFEMVTVP